MYSSILLIRLHYQNLFTLFQKHFNCATKWFNIFFSFYFTRNDKDHRPVAAGKRLFTHILENIAYVFTLASNCKWDLRLKSSVCVQLPDSCKPVVRYYTLKVTALLWLKKHLYLQQYSSFFKNWFFLWKEQFNFQHFAVIQQIRHGNFRSQMKQFFAYFGYN